MKPQLDPAARPRRPLYLTASLALVWVMGLSAATDGFGWMDVLHNPAAAQAIAEKTNDPRARQLREAIVTAVLGARQVAAPLAAAGVVLGSLLAVSAGLM